MQDVSIDRAVHDQRQAEAAAAAAQQRKAAARARQSRARESRRAPVATIDGRTLRLRQPRLYLLFGRPFAWTWLAIMAVVLSLAFVVPWWGVVLALVPVAIPWSANAWARSRIVRVTEQGNVGVSNGLWRTGSAPAGRTCVDLTERGLSGWLGECVITTPGGRAGRVLGLTEQDFAVVTQFAAMHGIRVDRSRYNFSVTISG